jgi:hypothetical protein
MAQPPSPEAMRVREEIIQILEANPGGLRPIEITRAIYGNNITTDPDDEDSKTKRGRVQYQLRALTQIHRLKQTGFAAQSTYTIRPEKEKHKINIGGIADNEQPQKRTYKKRGSGGGGATNGAVSGGTANVALIKHILGNLRRVADDLEEALKQ